MVSKRPLEVRDLDETVTREEVLAALCIALGKPDLGDQCRLYKRFGGVLRCQTCADRGEKDFAHASGSGSCPIFRVKLRRLRGGK